MRVRVMVPVAMLLVAGSAGCGKGSTEVTVGPPTAGLLSEAAGRTRAANTGHVEGTVSLKGHLTIMGDEMTYDLGFGTNGEYDLGARRDHLLVTLTSFEMSETSPTTRRGTTTTDPTRPGDTFEQFGDADHYVERRVEGGKPKVVDGKEWVRKERRKSPSSDPFDSIFRLSGLDNDGQTIDPDVLLSQIEKVSDDVSELPGEDVRGMQTRHLRASVSVLRLYDDAVRSTGTTVRYRDQDCTRDAIRDLTIAVDVNIGTDGYVRRLALNSDLGPMYDASLGCTDFATGGSSLPAPSTPSRFALATNIDYFDIGQPVTFTPPDEAAVTERKKFTPVGTAIS